MSLAGDIWDAFNDPNLNGPGETLTHIRLSLVSLGIAAAIGIVLGIVCAKVGRAAAFAVVTISNLGRTIPTFAAIALVLALTALGFWPAAIGLIALGIPPILLNTFTGIREVDAGAVEAARGMGMTPVQVLGRVEMPVALPLIFAGLRVSAVQVVATAALAGVVGAGGLGVLIEAGRTNGQTDVLLAGAIPTTLLALTFGGLLGAAERLLTPKGLRLGRRSSTLLKGAPV